uniref:Uncharacterized protein n=1 Tax=Timema cristinae TaxID=61476 RepID=A0A7R9DIN0_TIMCR|nr:unnamed protein product [Timema cristinae]
MTKAKKFILARHFDGEPKESDLKLVEEELPPIKDGVLGLAWEFICDSFVLLMESVQSHGSVHSSLNGGHEENGLIWSVPHLSCNVAILFSTILTFSVTLSMEWSTSLNPEWRHNPFGEFPYVPIDVDVITSFLGIRGKSGKDPVG